MRPTTLLDLPPELLIQIASHIDDSYDLGEFLSACTAESFWHKHASAIYRAWAPRHMIAHESAAFLLEAQMKSRKRGIDADDDDDEIEASKEEFSSVDRVVLLMNNAESMQSYCSTIEHYLYPRIMGDARVDRGTGVGLSGSGQAQAPVVIPRASDEERRRLYRYVYHLWTLVVLFDRDAEAPLFRDATTREVWLLKTVCSFVIFRDPTGHAFETNGLPSIQVWRKLFARVSYTLQQKLIPGSEKVLLSGEHGDLNSEFANFRTDAWPFFDECQDFTRSVPSDWMNRQLATLL